MFDYFSISVTFLDRRYHGRGDGGKQEWPPSPLRLFQALVAANADQIEGDLGSALNWIEKQAPPEILAPRFKSGMPYQLSVPNNAMDLVAKAWSKGEYFGKKDNNPATHRTMKIICPIHMLEGDTVHYLWHLTEYSSGKKEMFGRLVSAVERIHAVGWGIDTVVSNARILTPEHTTKLSGVQWKPCNSGINALRTPLPGTLDALRDRHTSFLKRVDRMNTYYSPVEPLSCFKVTHYCSPDDSLGFPYIIFQLRNDDDTFFSYPQGRLIHLAGMMRHVALDVMKTSAPPWIKNVEEWLDTYVAGHVRSGHGKHRQLSYVPLPSIGHRHADHYVRRMMITAPIGDEQMLKHLASRISGHQLKPECKEDGGRSEFAEMSPPTLVRVSRDNVSDRYTQPTDIWASVTPVILPGHTDRNSAKTVKLIQKALTQSGIEQPCTYEWREMSWYPKSLSSHKFNRNKKQFGYIRPDHLLSLSAVHLKIRFKDKLSIAGPLLIGAGRHCGLGVFAALDRP